MATLNVELSDSALQALRTMAEERNVPISRLIESFTEQPFFELSDDQLHEIDLANEAIDRGQIASEEKVKAFFAKYAE
jgi:predicted transcriptional regulator